MSRLDVTSPQQNMEEHILASNNVGNNRILKPLAICGAIMLIGYVGLFCLLQSPAIWYNLRPDPIRSLFPDVFRPINAAFPQRWVYLDRTHNFALVMAPIYLAVVALITSPLLYLLKRLSRPGALRRANKKPVLWAIFGFTLAIMLVLLFERGLLSSDIYSNVWYTRIWVEHGASPFNHMPNEFPPDPEGAIYWVGWQQQPLVYGPAWLVISAASYKFGQSLGGTFSALLLSSRLLTDAAHLLNAWLVWSITGLILAKRRPRFSRTLYTRQLLSLPKPSRPRAWLHRAIRTPKHRENTGFRLQTAALLFYLWNPLLLVEFAGNGHNDVLMLTFVLLAVWLHLKGRWPLAALALGVATLVKLPAIIFVPGYVWLLLWEGARVARAQHGIARLAWGAWRATQALAIMVAAWVVLYIPFWGGPSTLLPLVSGPANRMYLHSLGAAIWWNAPELLANALGIIHGREHFIESIQHFLDANLRIAFIALLGLVALMVTWRARTFNRMLIAWGWLTIAAIMTQGWFWPWYVSWAVVPASLALSKRLRNATLIFSVSALLHYIEEQILGQHFKLFVDWSGAFIMLPPLIYILFSWLSELRQNRRAYNLSTSRIEERHTETFGQPEPAR